MAIKNILCAYNGRNTATRSLDYALRLAKHHGAFLTGVVRHSKPVMETRFAAHLPKDVIDAMHRNDTDLIAAIAKRFEAESKAAGLSASSEFIEIADKEDLALGAMARPYDLVVTGVPSEDVSVAHLTAHPDLVALHSGRPVLVVPDSGSHESLADHTLVAWDGGRSAARALGDALAIQETHSKVTVLYVGSEAPKGTEQLLNNLRRHGVAAELLVKPKKTTVSDTIVKTAEEIGANFIVMGAYERSKFSHDMFGGPTTDVMRHSKVAVLLSH
ncbi:universal stress protein [Pacificoceanicola onchidii]|uniref:universal stress protein n=1 Tax=Pacificoceanicola onchidii TaxID=2562685 RepID=UPI0010A5D703|nr:universal stress protein [Pacificoceanicola onchidii]